MHLVRYAAIVSATALSFPATAGQAPPKASPVAKPVTTHMNVAPDASGSVPFQVSINGDGAVRWGPMLCAPKAGAQSALCNRTAPKGKMLIVQAFPANGLKFAGWAGACAGQGIRCVLTPAGPTTLSATFAPPAQQAMATIKVAIPAAGGRVGPDPFTGGPIDCKHQLSGYSGGTCQASVPVGSQVILVANAEPKASFAGWQSDQSGCSGQTCAFTVSGPTTLTANFTTAKAPAQTSVLRITFQSSKWASAIFNTIPSIPFDCPTAVPQAGENFVHTCTLQAAPGTELAVRGKVIWGGAQGGGGAKPITQGWAGACAGTIGAVCTLKLKPGVNDVFFNDDWQS